MGGVFRAPKIQQRVVPVVDTEAEAKNAPKRKNQKISNASAAARKARLKRHIPEFWAKRKMTSNAKTFWENKYGT